MKKLKLLLISMVMSVVLPGTSVLAEIGFMRDVNTGCGEIAVDCSTCHDLNDFDEYTENQGNYKSYGGEYFCVDGTWEPIRLSNDDLLDQAQKTTNLYFEELFGQFMSHMAVAIAEVNADPEDDKVNPFVEVFPDCPELAAEIASDFSRGTGSLVRRVTNRTRNARNTPDIWEASQLKRFEQWAEQGKPRTTFLIDKPDHNPPETISQLTTNEFETWAITDGPDDTKYFRYTRSITLPPLTMLPCLKCHGSIEEGGEVTADVLEAIEGLYPYDMALGYKAGNIRGAWTIKIPIVEGEDD